MLAPKSIALLVAGIILITALFSVFHVTYPTGNPVMPPIQPKQYQLFKYQFKDTNLLGNSTTSFTPSTNGTVTIEGYVYGANSTGTQALGSSYLYAAVFPAETYSYTSNTGFFQITVVKYGQGTFAFQVPGYNSKTFKLDLMGGSYQWLNITLQQAQKYRLSGTVVDQNGHNVSSVNLTMSDFIQAFSATSSSKGGFSIDLYNGTYAITTLKSGYSTTPSPQMVTISGHEKSNFTITLQPKAKPAFYVSGYIMNVLGKPISGATVTSSAISNYTTSNSSGYYSIEVPSELNIIEASAPGYGSNYTIQYVQMNLTDINLTLSNKNPFPATGSSSTGSGLSSLPPGTVKNITSALGNNTNGSSKINYGNNTTSQGGKGMVLQGNVTDSNNSAPVALTNLYFYIDVNGSYFYSNVKTNATGFYQLALNYTGHYIFYVYSPLYRNLTFSIWINGTTNKDLKLTPLPGHNFLVQGIIRDHSDGTGIPGNVTAYIYNTGMPILEVNSDSSGLYSMYLIQGNYSFKATSIGFSPGYNSTGSHPLIADSYENFSLDPINSLGSGSSSLGGTGSSGIPGLSNGNVTSQLNNSNGGNSLPNGSKPVNIYLHLENASNSASLVNMQFSLYVRFNSNNYVMNYTTDSKGNATIPLPYEGNYTFLPESVYYYGTAQSYDVKGSMNITMGMEPKPVHSMSVELINAYNYTRGSGTLSVPVNYLNITNYKDSLNMKTPTGVQGVGTFYNYTVPDGNYTFQYTNPDFVSSSFSIAISGASGGSTQYVKPYLVVINTNSVTNYTYSISPLFSSRTMLKGSYTVYTGIAGPNSYTFTSTIGNKLVNTTSFTLDQANSVELLNMTIKSNTAQGKEQNAYAQQSNLQLTVVYNYTMPGNGYIYSMFTGYVLGANGASSLSNISQISFIQANETSGTFLNLTTYAYENGGQDPIYITTSSSYTSLSYWETQFATSVNSVVQVSYYTPALNQATVSGGL